MIRCSFLPLFRSCAQSSITDSAEVVDHDIKQGRIGDATHEALRVCFTIDPPTSERMSNICAGFGVEPKAVWPLYNRAHEIIKELGLPNPDEVETPLQNDFLTGHPDATWDLADEYVIGDWKGSRLDLNYFHQLMGYAKLELPKWRSKPKGCRLFVGWLQDGTVEQYRITVAEIEEWSRATGEQMMSEVYTAGAHCTHCPRVADCPAQRESLRQAIALVGDGAAVTDVSALPPDTVAKVHRALKLFAAVKAKWDPAIKERIRATGPVDMGDGYQLAIVTENGAREIDAIKAWPVMTARLTDEELATCLRVSVTALESAVATKAQRAKPRSGAEAKRALAAELEAAGAISQGTVEKLKEVRTQNLPPKESK